jgi:predicted ATPase
VLESGCADPADQWPTNPIEAPRIAEARGVMTQPADPTPYIFLSYASADRPKALHVADLLAAQGITVWIDRTSIAGGTSWSAEIVRGIQGCSALAVLISTASMASPNVQQEIQLAWESRRPILPLILEPARMPEAVQYALAGRQWVEVLERPDEEWTRDALRALAPLGVASASRKDDESAVGSTQSRRSTTPDNLPLLRIPASPTPIVGRTRELAQVEELLLRADSRLVTLTGPGGIGKTRLALQVAADIVSHFADGVFFVPLASIGDPGLVGATIAQVLEVGEIPGRSIVDALKQYLHARSVLLVVDNFEHVLAAAMVVSDLLAAAPRVKALITSRETLHLRGEHDFSVPPLGLPDLARLPSVEELNQYDAIRLFIDRVREARPDFTITRENALTVSEICSRLDGLPLAIELAAARTRLMSPSALLSRLERRLPLLTGGARDLPARQQTLRNAIAWSYDLLDEGEKALFRQLAVFAGGCTFEAIEAVCGAQEDLLDQLGSLVDKSLLRQQSGDDGELRFGMFTTIREYGLEQLAAQGETARLQEAHASYYLDLVERDEPGIYGAHQVEWLNRLEPELDNVRAALQWARSLGKIELGLRLASGYLLVWYMRGYLTEGRGWLDDFVAAARLAPVAIPDTLQAKALLATGAIARVQSDFPAAQARVEESLALFRKLGDRDREMWALIIAGLIAMNLRHLEEAQKAFEESLALARLYGAPIQIGGALCVLGMTAYTQGRYTEARRLLEEGVTMTRGSFNEFNSAVGLAYLGHVARDLGDAAEAARLYRESLIYSQPLRERLRIAWAFEGLGTLREACGGAEQAVRALGAAAALREAIGSPMFPQERAIVEYSVQELRATLGEENFQANWATGQAMTLEQAIANALRETDQ